MSISKLIAGITLGGGKCCGCTACLQRCPRHCITLSEDSEGFLYPRVDGSVCTECGLCEKVCPVLHPQEKATPLSIFAAKNRNERERMDSSSGGVFLPLAREVVKRGGVVFGAVYDEAWEVHHVAAGSLEEVYPMMGSKYVQSRIGDTYREAELLLKQGREVMFVGSPCQIAGLRAYLRHREYPNLLAVDFVCHGVPSPGVWRRYLAETYAGYDPKAKMPPKAAAGENSVLLSSLNAKSPIGDIKFRDKAESGWGKYRFVVRRKSASKADQNTVLSSDIHRDNPFMRGFLADIYLRPSCYACRAKGGAAHSDITIGDFWGINAVAPEFNDDKGVGVVLVNTPKGSACFQCLDLDTLPSTMEVVHRSNGSYAHSVRMHPKRSLFYSLISQGRTVEQAVAVCLHVPVYRRALSKGKRGVKKVIKMVLGDAGVKAVKKVLGK